MSPLPPSRKDVTGPPPRDVSDLRFVLRHLGSAQRSMDPGYLGGTRATPAPVRGSGSQLVGQDGEGGDDDSVFGEDGDRHTLANLSTQSWALTYDPIPETLVVRWHPDAGAGVEWKRGEHYTIDDGDNVVTFTAATLAAAKAEVGDVFSAQYLHLEEEDAPGEASLFLRGTTLMIDGPATGDGIDLPDGTEVGDLIVALNATSESGSSVPGTGTIIDPRLTQVGYATWMGIATHLGPVIYDNPDGSILGSRQTGTVATFAGPGIEFLNVASSGPGVGGINSLAVPSVSAQAAIMGFIEENRNGFGGTLNDWPDGYTKVTASSGSTICKAYILYWPPDGGSGPPTGTVDYTAHVNGHTFVDVAGLQGDDW